MAAGPPTGGERRTHRSLVGRTYVGAVWFLGAPVTFHEDPVPAVPADLQARPTRPADRHVTLLFLGRVLDDAVQHLWGSLPSLGLPEQARAVGWERFGRR